MAIATIDGTAHEFSQGERLLDVINRAGIEVPQVCYHPQLGPIQTCDTCMVEVDGKLVRACATPATRRDDGRRRSQRARRRRSARRSTASWAITCSTARSATTTTATARCTTPRSCWPSSIRTIPFRPKPYEVDETNPFYRYDPDQCILCGRCVEACQNVQVNETLSIRWEDQHPRVLWDGGAPIGESSCVSCGHCVTVCPCNALMEKSMLGEAGFFTGLPKPALDGMIDVVKGIEPETGYGAIMKLSEVGSGDARVADQADEDGVHVLRRGMQLRCVDQGPAHPEGRAGARARRTAFPPASKANSAGISSTARTG